MHHVIVRLSGPDDVDQMKEWLTRARDGELFDVDVLTHASTFGLTAMRTVDGALGHIAVQQPLMLESYAPKPGLGPELAGMALARLTEYAIGEAYRRDAGELYVLSRDVDTLKFAERHHFKPLPDGLQVRRLNLLETFGA